jgi:uncharacterized membrane protein
MDALKNMRKRIHPAGLRRIILSAIVLISVLLMAQQVFAQPKTTDLTLWLRGPQNNYSNVVKAGQDNKFFLEVRNVGTERINNIQFSSDAPGDWIVAFSPAQLAYIDPGIVQTLDVNIHPPSGQGRGDHPINVIAQANEIRKVESFNVTVSLASSWLWVWGVVVLIIIIAFFLIYRVSTANKKGG